MINFLLAGPFIIPRTVQSVKEAIINGRVAAETMEGFNGNKAYLLLTTW